MLGIEIGGRFGSEAVACLRQLAKARARESAARLRPAVQRASFFPRGVGVAGAGEVTWGGQACGRWMGMLAVAAQRTLAYSLLELPLAAADECGGHGATSP